MPLASPRRPISGGEISGSAGSRQRHGRPPPALASDRQFRYHHGPHRGIRV